MATIKTNQTKKILLTRVEIVLTFFNKNEHVNSEKSGENHDGIQYGSPCQNNAALAELIGEELVLQRRKAEVRTILHLVQAFGASVNCSLCQTH